MSYALFAYPKQAEFNHVLPKSKIYEHAQPSRTVRDYFVSQISKIVWRYKLAPETINIPAHPGAPEIQVFDITLKTPELNEEVLRCIDRAIMFPIFYNLSFDGHIKTMVAYKRPSDSDASKWVIGSYFESAWLPFGSERVALPIALDLAGLYEQLLRQLMPYPSRPEESLQSHVERLEQARRKQNELCKLEVRLHKEVQFNRKVELNAQLRVLKNELEALIL